MKRNIIRFSVMLSNNIIYLLSFFYHNRTKEQLGYTVTCGPRLTTDVLGFCFTIQSSEYNPFYLQNRIDNFIDGLQKLLVCFST